MDTPRQEWERIRYDEDDGLAVVTLDRPEKRNALDALTLRELAIAFAAAEAAPDVGAVLLRGAGKDFCAGADLAMLERVAEGAGVLENLDDADALGSLFVRMRRCPKPIIAAVHGHAIAGGAGLATAADLIVASENAVFGYPEVQLGFVPAMVMALLRRSVGEKVAFELIMTGVEFDAREAHRLGLVNRVLDEGGFDEHSRSHAREIAARPASAVRLIKRLFYGMDGLSFEEAVARGAEVNVLARNTPETREGVRRFLEKQHGATA